MMSHDVLDRMETDFDEFSVRLIRKYAILLSIFVFIQVVLTAGGSAMIGYIHDNFGFGVPSTALWSVYFTVPRYLCHAVIAMVVYRDMRKTGTVQVPVIILTLFYDVAGVCIFLIYLFYLDLIRRIGQRSPSPEKQREAGV